MMHDLTPCPFCGGEAKLCHDKGSYDGYFPEMYSIGCSNPDCPIEGPRFFEPDLEDAIRAWNTRTFKFTFNDPEDIRFDGDDPVAVSIEMYEELKRIYRTGADAWHKYMHDNPIDEACIDTILEALREMRERWNPVTLNPTASEGEEEMQ